MISRIAAILILVAVLSQSLIKSFIVVNYQVNKTTIIKNYCENKAKPKMHCDGKCHLKKQLQKEENREENPSNGEAKDKSELQCFDSQEFHFTRPIAALQKLPTHYSFSTKSSSPQELLQPPKC